MSNMVVRTNIFALNSHRNMKNVGLQQKQASNRLSSGYRINSAADDAAGLAISETMRAQIRGLDQASRNAQDGQAMLLTTEGGLDEIGNMLQRTRELLVQASNDTNTQDQRAMIEQEIGQLAQEISSMQNRVEYNTNRVLTMGPSMDSKVLSDIGRLQGDNKTLTEASDSISSQKALIAEAREALNTMDSLAKPDSLSTRVSDLLDRALGALQVSGTTIANDAFSLDLSSQIQVNRTADLGETLADITESFGIGAAVTDTDLKLDEAVTWDSANNVTQVISLLNARDDQLDAAVTALNDIKSEMMTDARKINDGITDFRNSSSLGGSVAFFQVGANSGQGIQFDFENVSKAVSSAASVVQLASVMVSNPKGGSGIGSGIDVSPLVGMVQSSIDDINSIRANLGAVQNRMDYTMRSLDIASENLADSESRVKNADMAKEMMKQTMSNVLQQASVAMLSQANQMPNSLMQLLR